MGILSNLFSMSKPKIKDKNKSFYENYNELKIEEFKSKYDLSTIEGINSIPISEAKRYSDGGKSVVYMPEQILNRQATVYKKENKFDLAIACLKKANEMYPYSFYSYTRDNYERLTEFMILAGKYEEAKETHRNLDISIGTRLDELRNLQRYAVQSNTESFNDYQKHVIDPYVEESKEREQYYWLLENAHGIAPKSFSAYRKMKNLNSDSYKKIVQFVENKGMHIEQLKFWI